MEPDDEAPLTLSKWPFYVGDCLLVGIALAIAMLGGWQLSNWQVATCVIAVALGAALFVLPYVVGYHMRRGEVADDQTAEMRLLQAHLKRLEAALIDCHERIKALESASGSARQYELLAAAVDQKFAAAAQTVAGLSSEVVAIGGFKAEQLAAMNALQAQLDGLSAGSVDSTVGGVHLDAFQARVAELDTRLTQIAEPIESVNSRLQAVEAAAAAQESMGKPAPRAARQRRTSDSGLLHRAMQEKQDSSSTAVSRIIDAKLNLKQAAGTPKAEPTAGPTTESCELTEQLESIASPPLAVVAVSTDPVESTDVSLEASESVEELTAEGGAEMEAAAETPAEHDALPEAIAVLQDPELPAEVPQLELDDQESAREPELWGAVVGTHVAVEVPAASETSAESSTETAGEAKECGEETLAETAPEDLFAEVVSPLASRVSVKKNDAVLTVSILIGIGNKPYLRGSGWGLRWEAGVPMEFEELGKWCWVAPADMDGSVEVQVFRNDEDADRKGTHVLEAGQKLEVTPVF